MNEKEYRLSLDEDEVVLLLVSINTEVSERERFAKSKASLREEITDTQKRYIAGIKELKALYEKILYTVPNKKELPGDQTI